MRPLREVALQDDLVSRACYAKSGEADALREETGMSTGEELRDRGPGAYVRNAEITSGRATSQQGLATTCKDPLY
jgi:hypothetical protein